jgi:hypothetical protein
MTFVVLREKVRAVRRVRDIDGMFGRTSRKDTNFQTMLSSAQSTDWKSIYKRRMWRGTERSRISVYPSIVAASGSFSMGCVGLSKREGGTVPTRNVEENRGRGVRSRQVRRRDWMAQG